jgi:putative drug exporter of the RND superfamily
MLRRMSWHRLQQAPAGRRTKWLIIGLWIVAALGLGSLQPRLQAATENDPATFLPAGAESTRALEVLEERFDAGGVTPAVVVRGDGADAEVEVVPLRGETVDELEPQVRELREREEGLVTGPAGLLVDAVDVFQEIDGRLLVATSLLILVLLVLIYRSPLIALVPLLVVATAYSVAAGLLYLLVTGAGLAVNGQTTGLLIILMFGAGTDYCLLLVARFREELRAEPDAHRAMARTVSSTAPAILSSGGTVAAAMLVLALGDLGSTRTAGPVLALGIVVTMIAGLTLLPALLVAIGRRAFWPAIPRAGSTRRARLGLWPRLGGVVRARPLLAVLVTVPLLAGAMGNLLDVRPISIGEGFRAETESVQGLQALERQGRVGALAPADAIVPAGDAEAARERLAAVEGVAAVREEGRSADGGLARLAVVLDRDPYGAEAVALVDDLRRAAGPQALVGGATAEEADARATVRSDFRLIAPLALLLIFLILALLLRSLVLPAVLVVSQVVGFAATLGLAYLLFEHVLGSPGSDASLPTFVFIFTVALGVDYSIFLMARVREEVLRRGHAAGVERGLVTTGGVITSAGVILAGTFLVLTTLPLEQLYQLGIAIALGVLIDTFVVRTLVVPGAALLLGSRTWWPGGPERLLPRRGPLPRPAERV